MNNPIFKTFAQGVQVLVWRNDKEIFKQGVAVNIVNFKVKPENTYIDSKGIRQKTENFELEKIPLLIASLQKIYERFSVKCYEEGVEVSNML